MLALALFVLVLGPLTSTPAPRPQTDDPLQVLVVSGANNHWWQWTTPSLVSMLDQSGRFEVRVTEEPQVTLADAAAIADVDVFLLDYNGPRWGEAAEANFVAAVRAGAGVSVIHAANNAFTGWQDYETMVGVLWREGAGHGKFHPFDVEVLDREHPITRNLSRFVAHPDELYHRLSPTPGSEFRVLMQAFSSEKSGGVGAWQPMALVNQFGAGRIFHTPLGHVWQDSVANQVSHTDPQFRALVVRGTEWAATGRVSETEREPNTLTALEQAAGWQSLFDGRSFAGWREFQQQGPPADGWSVEDGSLRIAAGAPVGDLVTELDYQDFELAFEWKVSEGANSGVMYRVSPTGGTTYLTGPEYQVLDDAHSDSGDQPLHAAGALYGLYAAQDKLLRPTGEWNTGRIVLIGNRVEHWLNGTRVVACELASEDWNSRRAASKFAGFEGFGEQATGRIVLQNHGNEVWFRNLRVRDLSPRPERARPLFDGSFADWAAFLDEPAELASVWQAVDQQHFVCAGTPRGYLYTEQSFENFVLRFEWRWNAELGAGNSGALLRTQLPHQVWPQCIEAQLMSARAGDFWRIGDYPMATDESRSQGLNTLASSQAENPVGEWNQYEILVDRGDVVLRINGQLVNQGRNAAELPGPIALQSEGAEIHFRALTIQELH